MGLEIYITFIRQQQESLGFVQAKDFFRLFDFAVRSPDDVGLQWQSKQSQPLVLARCRQRSHVDSRTAEDVNQTALNPVLCQFIEFLPVGRRKDLLLQALQFGDGVLRLKYIVGILGSFAIIRRQQSLNSRSSDNADNFV